LAALLLLLLLLEYCWVQHWLHQQLVLVSWQLVMELLLLLLLRPRLLLRVRQLHLAQRT
jgi:hypothetical protein